MTNVSSSCSRRLLRELRSLARHTVSCVPFQLPGKPQPRRAEAGISCADCELRAALMVPRTSRSLPSSGRRLRTGGRDNSNHRAAAATPLSGMHLTGLLAAGLTGMVLAAPPSIETFAARAAIEGAAITPDGRHVAIVQT